MRRCYNSLLFKRLASLPLRFSCGSHKFLEGQNLTSDGITIYASLLIWGKMVNFIQIQGYHGRFLEGKTIPVAPISLVCSRFQCRLLFFKI